MTEMLFNKSEIFRFWLYTLRGETVLVSSHVNKTYNEILAYEKIDRSYQPFQTASSKMINSCNDIYFDKACAEMK